MKTICAWCEQEGAAVILAEREPADDGAVDYGICPRHTAHLVAVLHRFYPPRSSSPPKVAAA